MTQFLPEERRAVQFGAEHIGFVLERTGRRKTVAVSVGADGVRVLAPSDIEGDAIDALIRAKGPWLVRKLTEFRDRGAVVRPREYVSGESYSYLGRQYRLKVLREGDAVGVRVRLRGAHLLASVDSGLDDHLTRAAVRSGLKGWYNARARTKLPERGAIYAERLGMERPPILVRGQEKRWGSCDTQGQVRINYLLMMAPIALIDYVVAHEFCHLLERNHSRHFWRLLQTIMPDCFERQSRLRYEGAKFTL